MIVRLIMRGKNKGVVMNIKKLIWLTILLLLLAVGCESVDVSKDSSALLAEEVAEAELSRQLKINRDTLLKGSSERIRVDSATVMLFSEDPMARKVLLEALRQTEVVAARMAICKSLSQARTEQKQIRNKEEFIEPLFEILNNETDHMPSWRRKLFLFLSMSRYRARLRR